MKLYCCTERQGRRHREHDVPVGLFADRQQAETAAANSGLQWYAVDLDPPLRTLHRCSMARDRDDLFDALEVGPALTLPGPRWSDEAMVVTGFGWDAGMAERAARTSMKKSRARWATLAKRAADRLAAEIELERAKQQPHDEA
jgi:hypothetical protein